MAPKSNASHEAASVKRGTTVKKKAGAKSVIGKVKQKNFESPWVQFPAVECRSCEQTTHDEERDAPVSKRPMALKWIHFKKVKKGRKFKMQPWKKECYPCFFVRRKEFKKIPQQQLDEERKASKEMNDKFLLARKKAVCGDEKWKRSKQGGIETSKEMSSYKDEFREGSFQPLIEFPDDRRLHYDPDDMITQPAKVAAKYPTYKVSYDEHDMLGVLIKDQRDGSYRWREGVLNSTKSEDFELNEDLYLVGSYQSPANIWKFYQL